MAEQLSKDEWIKMMQEKLEKIIDNSNSLCDIFYDYKNNDSKVIQIHIDTDHFANISKDELLFVAENLSKFIYATPIINNTFYVNEENDNREMLFFTNEKELLDFREKNNNCQFVFVRFRDFMTLKNYFGLNLFTVNFSNDYYLSFSDGNIDSFYNIYAYENTNSSSNYIIGTPSESYKETIEILSPKFKEFEEIKNVWLYHVLEMKDKNSSAINKKYEDMYDVFVIEMQESNYISIRDYIFSITRKTSKSNIKVVLYNSDMGMLLLNQSHTPIYTKN